MKLNKLAGLGALLIVLAQISALVFSVIELIDWYSFNWLNLHEKWINAFTWTTISISSINIIVTLLAMFKVSNDFKALSVWLALLSMPANWYPYFFPAVLVFTGAILLLAGKYQPVHVLQY